MSWNAYVRPITSGTSMTAATISSDGIVKKYGSIVSSRRRGLQWATGMMLSAGQLLLLRLGQVGGPLLRHVGWRYLPEQGLLAGPDDERIGEIGEAGQVGRQWC